MGRVLAFLLGILALAWGFIALLRVDGITEIGVNGQIVELETAWLLILGSIAALLLIFGTTIFSWLGGLPGRMRRRRRAKTRARGMTALTRGLEAVAAGDAEDAQRHARLADKSLSSVPLTRLLTAQAAQLAGDDATARESYAAMLETPETEFLGLRGLYLQAMGRGDRDEAKLFADRAFRLRPNAPWAFESVYALALERGAWGDAREALRLASRQGAQEAGETARKDAALLTAQAYSAQEAGDEATARRDAEAAVKKAPGLAPAAVLAARAEVAAGKPKRAAKIVETAWATAPHPALASAYREAFADLPEAKRAERLRRLAATNEDHPESAMLRAEADLLTSAPDHAIDTLTPLLRDRPTARVFALMADAVEASRGKAAAEPWLERAAEAPRDPVPGADGHFHLTTEGWQRLVREYGDHERLTPPPLEIVKTSLSEDEILALAAPEPEIDPAVTPEPEIVPEPEPTPAETPSPPEVPATDPGPEIVPPREDDVPETVPAEIVDAPEAEAEPEIYAAEVVEVEEAASAPRDGEDGPIVEPPAADHVKAGPRPSARRAFRRR